MPARLHHGVGGDEEILLQLLDGPDERGRGDQVAQAQAGHGVELGKPVEHEGPVGELEDAVLLALVDQAVVDLVGNDHRGVGPRGHSAISCMRSAESRLPVGLEGELMKIALVRAVIFSRMASGRNWKPSSS